MTDMICNYCSKPITDKDYMYKLDKETLTHKPLHAYHFKINGKEPKNEAIYTPQD